MPNQTKDNREPIREGNNKGNTNHAPNSPRPSTPPPSQHRPSSGNRQSPQSGNTPKSRC